MMNSLARFQDAVSKINLEHSQLVLIGPNRTRMRGSEIRSDCAVRTFPQVVCDSLVSGWPNSFFLALSKRRPLRVDSADCISVLIACQQICCN